MRWYVNILRCLEPYYLMLCLNQETCARRVRNSEKPFGGIQLILSGDFCQLPPVPVDGKPVRFAFDAQSWCPCMGPPVILTKVFRQKEQSTFLSACCQERSLTSSAFVDMLNEMRFGKLSQESIERFKSLSRELPFDDGIAATELCAHMPRHATKSLM